MKKRILIALAVLFSFIGSELHAQAIDGGAGVVFVDADPNGITELEDVTVNEANVAYNRTTQMMYVFDPSGTAGVDQWIAVDVTSVVTSVVGTNDISVTNSGGTYTVDFTETHTSLVWDGTANTLTYTAEDSGDDVVIDLSDLETDVDGSNSINVTGDGTSGTPYVIELDGAHSGANANMAPVTDGSGNLTWQGLVSSAAFNGNGELVLTLTDASTITVDMSTIPTASNAAGLATASTTLGAGAEGFVRADENNTFGIPATATYGVLFHVIGQ